jgi:hypothetical protein
MLAGLILPERPIGNMYFAAWSHNVISNAVNLSNDLKMGEYRTPLAITLSSILHKTVTDPMVLQSRFLPASCSSPRSTAPSSAASSTTLS